MGYKERADTKHIRQIYENERGVGIFFPKHREKISGISRVYGLAYIDEGWLETDRGIARVEVTIGDEIHSARLYVKNRYFVRTFDSTRFSDGELTIAVRAFDQDGNLLGSVSQIVVVDNAHAQTQPRVYAAPDGLPTGDGSLQRPFDVETALANLKPGAVLFLRGGEYHRQMVISTSGKVGAPTVIINHEDEIVKLTGAGIEIAAGVSHLIVSGIDQAGTRHDNFGMNVGADIAHVSVWDCSFCDNTHPYECMPPTPQMEYGTGLYAGVIRSKPDRSLIRRYFEVSHCLACGNDVDGFHLASTAHGRFQFLEACWTPDGRLPAKHGVDIYQYKHANGFAADNSEYRWSGFASWDIAYLFCYSHHNGQDGWDIRTPHVRLFGCVTHDEAYVGIPYGGVGLKFWEYDYQITNCVTFRNNLVDGTGDAFTLACDADDPRYESYRRKNAFIQNTAFYHADKDAINLEPGAHEIFVENCVIQKATRAITEDIADACHGYIRRCIFCQVKEGTVAEFDEPLSERIFASHIADPGFNDPEKGNFFPKEDSLMRTAGNTYGLLFDVDGVDYSLLDGLGRPRQRLTEAGPYTRYDK